MRNITLSLLSAAVALSLGSQAIAQNDDCTGAIAVTLGANGPFSNVGATTSTPALTCGLGGADVWYSWVATGSGNLVVDLCGSGYDTVLGVYDGAGGCGGLVLLGCNDDSCGLQSSLTVPVTQGTTYFFQVGGFNGATGSFSINLAGQFGVQSAVTSYGAGCVGRSDSAYQTFFPASTFSLSNSAMQWIPTMPGYITVPNTGSFLTPGAGAVALTRTDDSSVATPVLTTAFPFDGGTAPTLQVCSNGSVWMAAGNSTAYDPNVATMLSNPVSAFYTWHDFNPTIAGSGQVKFEEVGNLAVVTWDAVYSFGTTNPCTMQMQFDELTGIVTMVWQTMDLAGSTLGSGGYLVGYSPGGSSTDLGSVDFSQSVVIAGSNQAPLFVGASANPIIGNTITFDTSNITPTAPFGAITLGLANPNVNLAGFGMPGCFQYNDLLVTLLYLPLGSSTNSTSFNVPNIAGLHLLAQSFLYDPAAGHTPLGATSSNGLDLLIGNF
ncbi:MAG: hypothetical protein IT456_12295 [Planctomycetes bacterium]|nr:hypothetical protein [Planctomycetota bacterium]